MLLKLDWTMLEQYFKASLLLERDWECSNSIQTAQIWTNGLGLNKRGGIVEQMQMEMR